MSSSKSKNFFEKNKNIIIAVLVFIVVLLLFFCVYKAVAPQKETAIYGSRLKGIKDIPITDTNKNDIKKDLKQYGTNIKVRTQGRILNVTITLNNDVNRDTAKTLGDVVVKSLSKKQLKNYDIQIFVSKNKTAEDAAQFPIIGYKQLSKDNFSWTKDR